ncbi:MAG: hypothetical protein QXT43_00130 [Candidatus Micrarchaeaceae archaeon]
MPEKKAGKAVAPMSRAKAFVSIFRKPIYVAVALAAAAAYYSLFYLVIKSSSGIFFPLVPVYVIYALIATSALVFAIGIHSAARAYRAYRKAYSGAACSVTGTAISVAGSLVASCGCDSPILFPFVMSLGFDSLQALAFVSTIAKYNLPIFLGLIAVNLFLIYYQLGIKAVR